MFVNCLITYVLLFTWSRCNEIKPDSALLQEVKPPSWLPPNTIIFEPVYRGWGTAIYSPSLPLLTGIFNGYPGRVAVASTTSDRDFSLFIASIHAPIIKNRVFPHLKNIYEELVFLF